MRKWLDSNALGTALVFCGVLAGAAPARAQLSLYATVDLARRNSPAVKLAAADVARATAAFAESKDAYLPSINVGSSIGYSYGFPVGQPSIVNLEAHSLVVSFSQPDYVRAARIALRTAQLNLEDALDQVALETALDYVELGTIEQQLKALEEQKRYAARLGQIEEQRLAAGLESRMNATRAELNAAQADLKRLDLESQRALLRQRLANQTGLQPASMLPQPETIPGEPIFTATGSASVASEDASVSREAPRQAEASSAEDPQLRAQSAGLDASSSNALSKHLLARGDDHQNFRPLVSLGVNYSRYAQFNNYAEYYLRFQHNNFDAGLEVQLPLFDPSKRARARQSAAEAVHADVQAVQARDTAQEQVVQFSSSLPELRAQRRVARLQNELAGEQLESVLTQLQNGTGTPGAPALTPADEMQARIAERQRYVDMLTSALQLTKAELNLLRATGGIEAWVNTRPHTP